MRRLRVSKNRLIMFITNTWLPRDILRRNERSTRVPYREIDRAAGMGFCMVSMGRAEMPQRFCTRATILLCNCCGSNGGNIIIHAGLRAAFVIAFDGVTVRAMIGTLAADSGSSVRMTRVAPNPSSSRHLRPSTPGRTSLRAVAGQPHTVYGHIDLISPPVKTMSRTCGLLLVVIGQQDAQGAQFHRGNQRQFLLFDIDTAAPFKVISTVNVVPRLTRLSADASAHDLREFLRDQSRGQYPLNFRVTLHRPANERFEDRIELVLRDADTIVTGTLDCRDWRRAERFADVHMDCSRFR